VTVHWRTNAVEKVRGSSPVSGPRAAARANSSAWVSSAGIAATLSWIVLLVCLELVVVVVVVVVVAAEWFAHVVELLGQAERQDAVDPLADVAVGVAQAHLLEQAQPAVIGGEVDDGGAHGGLGVIDVAAQEGVGRLRVLVQQRGEGLDVGGQLLAAAGVGRGHVAAQLGDAQVGEAEHRADDVERQRGGEGGVVGRVEPLDHRRVARARVQDVPHPQAAAVQLDAEVRAAELGAAGERAGAALGLFGDVALDGDARRHRQRALGGVGPGVVGARGAPVLRVDDRAEVEVAGEVVRIGGHEFAGVRVGHRDLAAVAHEQAGVAVELVAQRAADRPELGERGGDGLGGATARDPQRGRDLVVPREPQLVVQQREFGGALELHVVGAGGAAGDDAGGGDALAALLPDRGEPQGAEVVVAGVVLALGGGALLGVVGREQLEAGGAQGRVAPELGEPRRRWLGGGHRAQCISNERAMRSGDQRPRTARSWPGSAIGSTSPWAMTTCPMSQASTRPSAAAIAAGSFVCLR
jgi:hypothetical protein